MAARFRWRIPPTSSTRPLALALPLILLLILWLAIPALSACKWGTLIMRRAVCVPDESSKGSFEATCTCESPVEVVNAQTRQVEILCSGKR